jgi:hypothetical protein
VPLSKIQSDVLKVIASRRDPESYIADGTPLNRDGPRFSEDIDVFHDREQRVSSAALSDAQALEAEDYEIKWLRQSPAIYTAEVTRENARTRLEWVADSDFRFFPTIPDEVFGYLLHPVDLATNKVMAAVGRREVRDLVDLVTVHNKILSLGATIWAAVDKSPGYTAEGLISEIRRNSHYPAAEWRAITATERFDPTAVITQLRAALDDAEAFVGKMPTDQSGLVFIEEASVVQPDPARLESYKTHAGQRRGQWPASAEITAEMFQRYML